MKKLVAVAEDTVEVVEVPMPEMQEDEVLIRTVRSLISPGSELKRVRDARLVYGAGEGVITLWISDGDPSNENLRKF